MTEQARAALTEAEIQARQAECLRRVEAGDMEAVFDFFLTRGIDLRAGEWEFISPD